MILTIDDDFDLEKICNCGQCFRAGKTSDGWYRFIHRGQVLLIRQGSSGRFETDADEKTWNSLWFPYFDLKRSYRRIRQSIPSSDPFLTKAAACGTGIRILRQDPWETLLSFIISQRKSIPAIRQSIELICEKWGTPVSSAQGTVFSFPSAAQMENATEEDFRACKAGYRAPYLLHAVLSVLRHSPDLDALSSLPCNELLEELMSIKGVGIKVANCVALFAYSQTAAAPVDTWIQKIITAEYSGRNPFPEYQDSAGILQQYAFYYAQHHKEEFTGEG